MGSVMARFNFRCMGNSTVPRCDYTTMAILRDEDHCGFMKNPYGPFADCLKEHPEVVDGFFDDCVYDACALWGNPDEVQDQICDALQDLYTVCDDDDIDWPPAMCPSCRCFLYFF